MTVLLLLGANANNLQYIVASLLKSLVKLLAPYLYFERNHLYSQ